MKNKLEQLPNIGSVVAGQLNRIGIHTADELRAYGSKQAWLAIRALDPSACYNRLCGLEGAVRGIRWHDLPVDVKRDLKEFYQSFKD